MAARGERGWIECRLNTVPFGHVSDAIAGLAVAHSSAGDGRDTQDQGWQTGSRFTNGIRLHERLFIDSCASAVGRERGWDVRGLLVESLGFLKALIFFSGKGT